MRRRKQFGRERVVGFFGWKQKAKNHVQRCSVDMGYEKNVKQTTAKNERKAKAL